MRENDDFEVLSLKSRKDGKDAVLFIEIGKSVSKAGLDEKGEFSCGIFNLQCV